MSWLNKDTFNFFVPANAINLEKAGKKSDKRLIQGIASTDSRDLQGEVVNQGGIDTSYFLKHGFLNDDHKAGPEHKVGQPTECRVTKNGLWIKGFLFKNHQRADYYWELMNALEASDSDRKVGFSIQGKVKRREGNKIAECWIQDIALTTAPVNTTTWAEIAKSLATQEWNINKADDCEEESEKAVTAGDSPLIPESLDKDKKEDRVAKGLTYDQAIEFLQEKHSLNKEAAVAVADVVFEVF